MFSFDCLFVLCLWLLICSVVRVLRSEFNCFYDGWGLRLFCVGKSLRFSCGLWFIGLLGLLWVLCVGWCLRFGWGDITSLRSIFWFLLLPFVLILMIGFELVGIEFGYCA